MVQCPTAEKPLYKNDDPSPPTLTNLISCLQEPCVNYRLGKKEKAAVKGFPRSGIAMQI